LVVAELAGAELIVAESVELLSIEVAYATSEQQTLVSMKVPAGTTVRDAARLAGLGAAFPQLDADTAPLGIFGVRVKKPELCQVREGDRVEIYRPLLRDPKKRRREKAMKDA
jgi:putative ubiquitin-RnfH superfamily antitoxin RatB of RatAB toxin-antitoxin module